MPKLVFSLVFLIPLVAMPAWAQRVAPVKPQPIAIPATVTQPATPPPIVAPPVFAQPTVSPPSTVEKKTPPTATTLSQGELKATPEMWFYEQNMREYKDPKTAVRANAEFTAQQRANRLAAMRWFGFSNSRPRISPDPVHVYPPAWSSNTPLQPNRWQGTGGQPYYVARPESSEMRTY